MRKMLPILVSMCLLFTFYAQAQNVTYNSSGLIKAEKVGKINQMDNPYDWSFTIQQKEAPMPGGEGYKAFIQEQKRKIKSFAYRNPGQSNGSRAGGNPPGNPVLENGIFTPLENGDEYGTPNDNDMAINSNGQVVSVINSRVHIYDLNVDSFIVSKSLINFAPGPPSFGLNDFDPKILYDPLADRWIFLYLQRGSSATRTVIAFSETDDATGNWNIYTLNGNPFNNNVWSDYPQWALTEDQLFYTVNLIQNGVPWETGFVETVVWQIDLNSGYGDSNSLKTRLWHDIEFEGQPLRYLNPVEGGVEPTGPEMHLVSNRPWDMQNDTFFLVRMEGGIDDTTGSSLTVDVYVADIPYGMPPNAQMTDTTLLQTNDARVLGSFLENGLIQFVGNTINPGPQRAAIYHGVINIFTQEFDLQLISSNALEFGYPNIAYTGTDLVTDEAIISFNHVGQGVFPGMSALYYDDADGYSEVTTLIDGKNPIELLTTFFSDSLERWGDYTGSQRSHTESGVCWISGYHADTAWNGSRVGGTFIAKVKNPASLTSIEEPTSSLESFKVFPNPATTFFTAAFTADKAQVIQGKIMDIQGRLIKEFAGQYAQVGENKVRFNAGYLSTGQYLIELNGSEGLQWSQQLLIK